MASQIVDATLAAAPRQCNADAEKARIGEGETAAEIRPDAPAKARERNVDACCKASNPGTLMTDFCYHSSFMLALMARKTRTQRTTGPAAPFSSNPSPFISIGSSR